jgi:hypothetical protein
MNKTYFFFPVFLLLLCGCQSSFGPRALKYTHPAYNQVIVNTLDQQMLLNLVRLKYRDSAFFLNINSVTASFGMGADIGVEAELPWDFDQNGVRLGDGRLVKPNIGMSYSQSPTISYTPLQGEDFLEKVLTPIPVEALLILTQSGWRIDRVFAIALERINDLHNAPRASGPTPSEEPQYKKFQRMLELLYQLQIANLIEIGPHLDVDKNRIVMVLIKADPDYQNVTEELKSLLGITQESNQFRITRNFLDYIEGEWDVRTRSMSSMLYYLSQNVEVPEKHKKNGLVTITKSKDGEEFNWDEPPAGTMLKVRSKTWGKPDNAFVSVPYRGAWFYIADNDLNSKSTFTLLKQLFSLQAGYIREAGPTLTLPVGGG